MIGTTGATVLLVINIVLASLVGVAAGGLACLALRRAWGPKTAVIDGVLAAAVAIVSAYVVASIDDARGVWDSRVGLVLAIAAASAAVRHLVQPAFRPSK